MKGLEFRDSSLSDLRDFPHTAMRDVGHQLDRAQKELVKEISK
jgi:phage-related protein